MPRAHLTLTFVLTLSLAACGSGGSGSSSSKKGPLVVKGDGVAISAEEFKARIDEQSPFMRQRFRTLEGKKEFLDNLVRIEVLSNEAKKRGFDKDPDVQQSLKRIMVQKLVQKTFNDGADATKEIPEADQKKYYDDHRSDYSKPKKVRLLQIFWAAAPGSPERATKTKQARELLTRIKTEEPKTPAIFATLVRERSEDQATKNAGGDLGFKSQEDLSKLYGAPFADAAFGAKTNDLLTLESAQGIHVVKVSGQQEAFERTFDQVKGQIASRLLQEKRRKDFDEYVKKLREQAKVTVNDTELEKVEVAAAPMGPGGTPPMGMGPSTRPPLPPQSAPATPPAAPSSQPPPAAHTPTPAPPPAPKK